MAGHASTPAKGACLHRSGGSFDFLSGRISRAPLWMQRIALEWLYRTIQDPSRLAKRYASNMVGLLRYLPIQIVAMATQTKRRSQVLNHERNSWPDQGSRALTAILPAHSYRDSKPTCAVRLSPAPTSYLI